MPARPASLLATRYGRLTLLLLCAVQFLVYALVRAPEQGWGSARTMGELATAAVALAAFTATELRRRGPLSPPGCSPAPALAR